MEKPLPAYEGSGPFVFISYSHADDYLVYPEIRWLQDQGVNVWYDEGISGASRWRDAIAENIAGCRLFLLYVSASSVASQVCREELEYALDQRKSILSISFAPAKFPTFNAPITFNSDRGCPKFYKSLDWQCGAPKFKSDKNCGSNKVKVPLNTSCTATDGPCILNRTFN